MRSVDFFEENVEIVQNLSKVTWFKFSFLHPKGKKLKFLDQVSRDILKPILD